MTELATLTAAEADCLADCEQRIARGLETFFDTGMALTTVRDNRLYRASHGTFEAYLAERWNITGGRARQLMIAAATVTTVTVAGLPAPANEGQARELARVPEAERAEVWQQTVERTDGKPTAAAIRETYERTQAPAPMPEPEPEASTSAGSGHDHPTAGEADAPLAAEESERPACEAPDRTANRSGAGDPLPADIAAQIEQRIAEKVARNADVAAHNAWVRELDEQIPAETKAEVAELGRRITPVTAVESGCRFLLDAVRGVNPELAVSEAPAELRHRLDVVHEALEFLTRVADAMKPTEVAA